MQFSLSLSLTKLKPTVRSRAINQAAPDITFHERYAHTLSLNSYANDIDGETETASGAHHVQYRFSFKPSRRVLLHGEEALSTIIIHLLRLRA